MGIPSAAAVASMRATLNRTLIDTATIYRRTSENVGGEEVESWSALSTIPCRIAPMTARMRGGEGDAAGGRIAEETTHVVTVRAGTDVEEADRVVVDEEPYEVTLVHKRGSTELSRRVEVKESVEGIPDVASGSGSGSGS